MATHESSSGSGGSGTTIAIVGGAIAAYYFWPQISAALGIGTAAATVTTFDGVVLNSAALTAAGINPATVSGLTYAQLLAQYPGLATAVSEPSALTTANPAAPQLTNSSPVTPTTPGATSSNGVSTYNSGVDGSGPVSSSPPGVPAPTPAAPTNNCQDGYTLDANGVCTLYSDTILLSQINSIQYTGSEAIPAEQIQRIDPQILASYASYPGITPGSVLAYILGLGDTAANGAIVNGTDGNAYQMINGVFVRQGTSTNSTNPATPTAQGALPATNTAQAVQQAAAATAPVNPAAAIAAAAVAGAASGNPPTQKFSSCSTPLAPGYQWDGANSANLWASCTPAPAAAPSIAPGTSGAALVAACGLPADSTKWTTAQDLLWQQCYAASQQQTVAQAFPSGGSTLNGLHRLRGAVPITSATLQQASVDPMTAALVGRDPRALLTGQQWNYYYAQATGKLQPIQVHPPGFPHALMSAADYQLARAARGLPVGKSQQRATLGFIRTLGVPPYVPSLGTIHTPAAGAFPLGSITAGPDRRPFITPGNNPIYRVLNRGAVAQRKQLGVIHAGGGAHRWARSPFPRPATYRMP